MWSNFSKDLNELAQNFKAESKGFMDKLGNIAADVVGHGGIYAGDEETAEGKVAPITTEALLQFQESDATYVEALSAQERGIFAEWAKTSPFSSATVKAHVQASTKEQERDGQWPDEPVDEQRQRLLDFSDVVLRKYMELVGEAVSPRSTQGSPAPKFPTSSETTRVEGGDTPAREVGGQSPTMGCATPHPTPTTPLPTSSRQPGQKRLAEDEFFDRYFFRLAQLRALEASMRALREAEAAERRSIATDEATSDPRAGGPASASLGSLAHGGADSDSEGVPLFAKKMLSKASELVANFDAAMNNYAGTPAAGTTTGHVDTTGRDPNGSDDDNVSPQQITGWREQQAQQRAQITNLEAVIQELQAELRKEAARVRQLEGVLAGHSITLPPAPVTASSTPIKQQSQAPESRSSPAATSTSVDATPVHADPSSLATPTASLPAAPPAKEATDGDDEHAAASTRRGSGNVSGLEADDEEWERVEPQDDE